MLGENCPVAMPTPEGFDMSCSEQNETSQDPPSAGSQQKSSDSEERGDGCSSAEASGGGSSSESTSTSGDGIDSEQVASVPETPLRKPVASTPQNNPGKRTTRQNGTTNQKTVRRLRTLWSVDQAFARYRNKIWLFKEVLFELKNEDVDYEAQLLSWAGKLVYHKRREKTYFQTLNTYTRRYTLDKELNPGPAPAVFDDMLFHLVDKAEPLLDFMEGLLLNIQDQRSPFSKFVRIT